MFAACFFLLEMNPNCHLFIGNIGFAQAPSSLLVVLQSEAFAKPQTTQQMTSVDCFCSAFSKKALVSCK
jgi:hypothetical protein